VLLSLWNGSNQIGRSEAGGIGADQSGGRNASDGGKGIKNSRKKEGETGWNTKKMEEWNDGMME
jgi:hypothetical protein